MLSFLILHLAAVNGVSAQQIDQHALYESRCAGCHESHAGKFVRANIDLVDGVLVGRGSGRSARALLESGHGRLSPEEVDVLFTHLASIQSSGFVFQDKCAICHVTAAELARASLILRDGELYGRYSGRDITEFLAGHGRLGSEEVPDMLNVLRRQLSPGVSSE